MNKPNLSEKQIFKCKILPKILEEIYFMEYIIGNCMLYAVTSSFENKGKNKKNFEKCWLSIINKGNFSKCF